MRNIDHSFKHAPVRRLVDARTGDHVLAVARVHEIVFIELRRSTTPGAFGERLRWVRVVRTPRTA